MIPLTTSACPMRERGQLLLSNGLNGNDILPGTIANFSFMVRKDCCFFYALRGLDVLFVSYLLLPS